MSNNQQSSMSRYMAYETIIARDAKHNIKSSNEQPINTIKDDMIIQMRDMNDIKQHNNEEAITEGQL
ncbi:unnamed protein product [Gordionus sp. m RMFG-2023]